jgi:Transposase DDE domain group 1
MMRRPGWRALTSDAGGPLLGAADRKLNLVRRLAGCFRDARDARFIEHSVATLVGQQVFGIALGYADLNDHDDLRHDPLMAVLAGKLEASRADCAPVAGKSTLNRLELSRETPTKYRKIAHDEAAIEALFVDLFLEAHGRPPKQSNARLVEEIAVELVQAEAEAASTGKPARRFKDFRYATLDSWSGRRRVIGKAEWTQGEANPRFIVTSLKKAGTNGRFLYEKVDCARGDMENRIKECQGDLYADRTSTVTLRANQLRL